MQLNNPAVQQSVHQALQQDPNFTKFIQDVQVSFCKFASALQMHQCLLLRLLKLQTCLWICQLTLQSFSNVLHAITATIKVSCSHALHLQGPSNLLPAPESEVVIEDVTDAPAEVSTSVRFSVLLFCYAYTAHAAI